jgi:Tfp pilus assembly protein PilF
VCQAQGRIRDADDLYRRAVKLHPDSWEAHNNMGLFLRAQNRYDDAAQEFQRVIQLTPDNAPAYLNLGAALFENGKLDEAETMFEKTIDQQPSSNVAARAYANLGIVYTLQRNFKEAEDATMRALELDGRKWITWENLAHIRRWIRDDTGALAAYRMALPLLEEAARSSDQDAVLQARLAEFYAYSGERGKAEARVEVALTLAPADHKVLLSAAKTYGALGERDRAVQFANEAVRKGLTLSELDREPEAQWFKDDSQVTAPTR